MSTSSIYQVQHRVEKLKISSQVWFPSRRSALNVRPFQIWASDRVLASGRHVIMIKWSRSFVMSCKTSRLPRGHEALAHPRLNRHRSLSHLPLASRPHAGDWKGHPRNVCCRIIQIAVSCHTKMEFTVQSPSVTSSYQASHSFVLWQRGGAPRLRAITSLASSALNRPGVSIKLHFEQFEVMIWKTCYGKTQISENSPAFMFTERLPPRDEHTWGEAFVIDWTEM